MQSLFSVQLILKKRWNIIAIRCLIVGLSLGGKQLHSFSQEPCKDTLLPVVMVYGFLASGDTWSSQAVRFIENGYCPSKVHVFDWNTLGGKDTDSLLDVFINQVLNKTGATKINLLGHSAGGGLCFRYLQKPGRAGRVAHYVHIGSSRITRKAGDDQQVPTLVIRSSEDYVLRDTAACPLPLIQQKGTDHLQVATSDESFREIYRFFHQTYPTPRRVDEKKNTTVSLSGRVVTFGNNEPLRNGQFAIYNIAAKTGERNKELAAMKVSTNGDGYWGPVEIKAGVPLEMETVSAEGRVVSYYFEPFLNDNGNVYLRTLPVTGLGALLLKKLPAYSDRVTLAVFNQNSAIIAGRDSLTVNGYSLSSPELCPAEATVISSFIFDDGDGISSVRKIQGFGSGIFVNAVDLSLRAPSPKPITIYCNGRLQHLPALSGSERVMVALFR